MPIEIRELVVKIAVDESKKAATIDEEQLFQLKTKIVKECIDKVMIKLGRQSER